MTIELDGRQFIDKETAFNYLIANLELPDYTGRNLDGLWDALYDKDALDILIYNAREIPIQLDDYGISLLDLFGDLHRDTDHNVIFFW